MLSLRPPAEKQTKLYKLYKELSIPYNFNGLFYIARSNDIELFEQVFNLKKVYNGDGTKPEIGIILNW